MICDILFLVVFCSTLEINIDVMVKMVCFKEVSNDIYIYTMYTMTNVYIYTICNTNVI